MPRLFSNGRYANVTATMALVVALGGTSYAAVTVTGQNIKNGTVKSADIGNGSIKSIDLSSSSVTSAKVKNGSLLKVDFKAGQFPSGTAGPAGPSGPSGPAGAKGDQGIPGTAAAKGDKGDPGAKGDKGDPGTAGTNGTNGTNGAAGPGAKWALVKADGTILRQSGGISVSGTGPGYYVNFGSSQTNAGLIATAAYLNGDFGPRANPTVELCGMPTPDHVACLAAGTNDSSHAFVLTGNAAGASEAHAFYITAVQGS